MSYRSAFIALLVAFASVGPAFGQAFEPLTPHNAPAAAATPAPGAEAPPPPAADQAPGASIFVPAPPAADAGNVFHDPNGYFTIPIPSGWTTSLPGDGSVQILQGPAWVVLVTVAPMDPQAGAQVAIDQMTPAYKLVQTNAAGAKVSGHPVYYAVFKGQSASQGPVAMMIAGIQAPNGHVLAFISSAPLDSITKVSPAFLSIMQGLRFAGE